MGPVRRAGRRELREAAGAATDQVSSAALTYGLMPLRSFTLSPLLPQR